VHVDCITAPTVAPHRPHPSASAARALPAGGGGTPPSAGKGRKGKRQRAGSVDPDALAIARDGVTKASQAYSQEGAAAQISKAAQGFLDQVYKGEQAAAVAGGAVGAAAGGRVPQPGPLQSRAHAG